MASGGPAATAIAWTWPLSLTSNYQCGPFHGGSIEPVVYNWQAHKVARGLDAKGSQCWDSVQITLDCDVKLSSATCWPLILSSHVRGKQHGQGRPSTMVILYTKGLVLSVWWVCVCVMQQVSLLWWFLYAPLLPTRRTYVMAAVKTSLEAASPVYFHGREAMVWDPGGHLKFSE